jgi:hypothetical protein
MCKHPVQSTTAQLTLLLAAANKEQSRALYANDTEDEYAEDLNDSDDDGPNDSDDEQPKAQNEGDMNDSDDDDHLESLISLKRKRERVHKARKQGNGSGALA